MAWKPLKIGGGGNITGMQIANDGTKVIRTDTYGGYVCGPSETVWRQFLLATAMPAADVSAVIGFANMGIYAVAIAPSDSTRIYIYFNGYIFRSNDTGNTFTRTAFSQVAADANTGDKGGGQRLVVDPQNPDIVYASTPSSGCFKTTNGGTSWATVGVSTATSAGSQGGGHCIAFDPTSSVVSSAKQGIFISTYGVGVYHSTNGGSSWTLLNTANMPTTHGHIICDSNGIVWQTDNSGTDNLYKWVSGTWSRPSVGSSRFLRCVAVDPNNTTHIFAHHDFDRYSSSTNSGTAWNASSFTQSRNAGAGQPGWLGTAPWDMAPSNLLFDPVVSGRMWACEGNGVWYTDNPPTTSGAVVTWNCFTAGIEQLIADIVIHPPGGVPICVSWDRAIFRKSLSTLNLYPSAMQYDTARSINRGAHIDYCAGTPTFLAAIVNSNSEQSGYSLDGGLTWTPFATFPTGSLGTAGSIAVNSADTNNILWLPGNNLDPWVTTNRGASWTQILLTGVPHAPSQTGWGNNQSYNHFACCADRVDADTFYMYNYGPAGTGADPAGVWKSTNKGSTWTQVFHGNIVSYGSDFFNSRIKAVPGQSGHLFFANGYIGGSITSVYFKRSTDHGATWTTVSNVLDVVDVGFGRNKPGQSYPAIYIVGTVSGVYGIYRSDDNCSTWINIGTYPFNWFDSVSSIDGDKDVYGRAYVGFISSSFAYYELDMPGTWKPLPLGGGGWLVGLDITPDGQTLCRADTFGAYILDKTTSTWQQFMLKDRFGDEVGVYTSGGYDYYAEGGGVYEIAAAPSNSAIIYCVFGSKLFKTTDRGLTWSRLTGYTAPHYIESNGPYRVSGRKLAVDPADPDHVIFSDPAAGVQRTINGGTSWTAIASTAIPFPTPHPGDWHYGPLTAITAASWASNKVTFTVHDSTVAFHSVGQKFCITNCVPTAYNGTYTAITGSGGATIVADKLTNPGTCTTFGQAFNDAGNGLDYPDTMSVMLAADTTSALISGRTGRWFAFANVATDNPSNSFIGALYVSTDAGATWTQTTATGGPTSCERMVCGQDGTVWLCDRASPNGPTEGRLWKYVHGSPGTWTMYTNPGYVAAVAVDPANANRVLAMDAGGGVFITTNKGTDGFTNITPNPQRLSEDVPWLGLDGNNSPSFTLGDAIFDPSASNKLIASSGLGVWYGSPSTSPWSLHGLTKGIEQMCIMNIVVPNGVALLGMMDKMIARCDFVNFPTREKPDNQDMLDVVQGLDFSKTDPNYSCAISGSFAMAAPTFAGYSTDNGQNWQPFNRWCFDWIAATALTAGASDCIRVTVPSTTGLVDWVNGQGDICQWRSMDAAGGPFWVGGGGNGLLLDAAGAKWFRASRVKVIDSTHFDLLDVGYTANKTNYLNVGSFQFAAATTPRINYQHNLGITAIANNGDGRIRVTVNNDPGILITNYGRMPILIKGVVGTVPANGEWLFEVVGTNQLVLLNSTFSGSYTSGGAVYTHMMMQGSKMACADANHIIVVPALQNYPHYSADGGKTWTELITPREYGPGGETGWGWGWPWYNHNHNCFCADFKTANTFYLYNIGGSAFPGDAGVYRVVNGVVTKALNIGMDTSWSSFHTKMVAAPTHAGHLFYTSGPQGGSGAGHPGGFPTQHSPDGGDHWYPVPGVYETTFITAGPAHPSSDFATVYFHGWYNGVYGIYRTTATKANWDAADAGNTTAVVWTKIGDYPHGWADGVACGAVDQTRWDRFVLGYGGSGASFYEEGTGGLGGGASVLATGSPRFTAPTLTAIAAPSAKVHFKHWKAAAA